MAEEEQQRVLIYKRTHSGDPDPTTGVFGNHDCMGSVRGWDYRAVIGVGGIGAEPERNGIARKLTWVGIGPRKMDNRNRPLVRFEHFRYYGEQGPLLKFCAPRLANLLFAGGVRVIFDTSLPLAAREEVKKILRMAADAPPSINREGSPRRITRKPVGKCRPKSCRGK